MKTKFSVSLLSILVFTLCAQATETDHQKANDDPWFDNAQSRLQKNLEQQQIITPAKNVILFIGDGMSVTTVTAARILEGQLRGESGEENILSFEHFPYTGLSKTYNTDSQTPDSAGTATAMLNGVKTKISTIGVNDKVIRNDCASVATSTIPSVLELAEQQGFRTGIVTTASMTHATPAAGYAHTASRGWENNAPEGCKDIATQLLEFPYGDGIEVLLGGGRQQFLPLTTLDPEYQDVHGFRTDEKNLIQLWQDKNPDGKFIWNKKQFNKLNKTDNKVFGLFEPAHMKFEADRQDDKAGEPSLAEMTEYSIQQLKRNKSAGTQNASDRGFFLLVEGGRIDHAHHATNAYRALHDTIALADAVKIADELTDDEDTLIIVTADHGHTMQFSGYPQRGNPILGKVISSFDGEEKLSLDATGKPYTTLGYLNGAGYSGESPLQEEGSKTFPHQTLSFSGITEGRPDLTEVDTEAKNYLQETSIPMSSETHSGTDVSVYAKGPSAHLLSGVYEQNYIFHVMHHALRLK